MAESLPRPGARPAGAAFREANSPGDTSAIQPRSHSRFSFERNPSTLDLSV